MARFSHKNAYIEFGGVDLSGRSNSCEIQVGNAVSEVTCFSEAWDEFVEDTANWKLSLAGFTDQDAGQVEDTFFAAVGAGAQASDYRPQGQVTGYKFTGSAFLTGFNVGGAMKGGCAYSATLQGTGTLSRGAV